MVEGLGFFSPRAIYTTNYDELIELGWQCRTTRPRIAPIFPDRQTAILDGWTLLFKPHGTAQHAALPVGDGGGESDAHTFWRALRRNRSAGIYHQAVPAELRLPLTMAHRIRRSLLAIRALRGGLIAPGKPSLRDNPGLRQPTRYAVGGGVGGA
jgi:hypothetical protein